MVKQKVSKSIGNDLEKEIKKIAQQKGFKVVRNMYIPYTNKLRQRKYTEIDLALVSKYGIYIVESKNYNCKIHGDISDTYLQTSYKNGKNYVLYNPLEQNKVHLWALQNFMAKTYTNKIFNIIVFGENSELAYRNVFNIDTSSIHTLESFSVYLDDIISSENVLLSDYQIKSVVKQLQARNKVSSKTKTKHKNQVRKKSK